MNKGIVALAVLLGSASVHAQSLTLHQAPDRAVYASSADWPYDSFQCHWSAKGANLAGDRIDTLGFNPNRTILDPAHVHLEMRFPRYAELNAPIVVPFTVLLRDFNGTFGIWGAGPFHAEDHLSDATDWWWDATQSSTPPVMIGDPTAPMGVQTFTGHFTMHPQLNFHGFGVFAFSGQAVFANGDLMQVAALESYWDNLDPTAPITMGTQGPAADPVMGTICSPVAANAPADAFGDNEMFVDDFLPTGALSGPWITTRGTQGDTFADGLAHHVAATIGINSGWPGALTNSYGGSTLLNTPGSYQTRHDLNFHMGIPGVIEQEIDMPTIIPSPVNIDNTGLAVGLHKWALIRFQPENSIQTNGVASLVVIETTVPDGTVVTPPTCTPPQQLVNNQCVTPVITPPPPIVTPPPPIVTPPPSPVIVNLGACSFATVDGKFTATCQ